MQFLKRLRIILQSNYFLVVSIFLLIIYIVITTKLIKYESKYNINTTSIQGTILKYHIDGDKISFLINGKEKVQATYYIKTKEEKEKLSNDLKIGLKVNLQGKLISPANNTIPNTFNYKEYLYKHKIFYLFQVSEFTFENKVTIFNKIKNWFIDRANNLEKTSSYMHAFILGDSSLMSSNVYENYRSNGVTHLFAVSGMHISIFIVVLDKLFNKIKKKDIIIVSILFFYMFLVGFIPSVIRASLLYLFLKINKIIDFNLDTKRVLYLLFLILLIINPFYIYDLGFLYSFTTSFGLLLFQKKINGNYLKQLFLVSLIAFLFSLPLTIYNFYEFNLLTVLNNILIVPFVSTILFPFSLFTFIFPFLEPILAIGFNILELLNNILNKISFSIVVPKIGFLFIFFYYSVIYLVYKYNFKYIFLIALLIFISKLKPYLDTNNYVFFLDVGQGDAALIISSNAKDIIMIDTGGKIEYQKKDWQIRNREFDLSENIATFINSLGLSHIDLLICSHGDIDHLGYAFNLKKRINIKKIMFNLNNKNKMEDALSKEITEVKNLSAKKIKMTNLNQTNTSNENESSLVILLELENKKFLFMGDAPKNVEQDIITKFKLNVDVLKLGHHGSKTSSDYNFLKDINPKYSIISSGRNNRYNHPSIETIENLNKLNLNYYNTQECGTIIYKYHNQKEKISFSPP